MAEVPTADQDISLKILENTEQTRLFTSEMHVVISKLLMGFNDMPKERNNT